MGLDGWKREEERGWLEERVSGRASEQWSTYRSNPRRKSKRRTRQWEDVWEEGRGNRTGTETGTEWVERRQQQSTRHAQAIKCSWRRRTDSGGENNRE